MNKEEWKKIFKIAWQKTMERTRLSRYFGAILGLYLLLNLLNGNLLKP